jgi:nucleoid DNA-binding protein
MSIQPTHLFKRPPPPKAPVLDAEMLVLIDSIRAGLVRDGHVQLYQFGTFRLKWGKPRRWVNPRTGEAGITGPLPRVTFTPAKHLRELVEPAPKQARPLEEVPEEEIPTARGEPLVVPVLQPAPSSDKPAEMEPAVEEMNINSAGMEPVAEEMEINLTGTESVVDDMDTTLTETQPAVEDLDITWDETEQPVEEMDIAVDDTEQPVDEMDIALDDTEQPFEDLNIAVAAAMEDKSAKKGIRGWQLALLAAVPLIIMLLQADFSSGDKTEAAAMPQQAQVAMVESVKPTEQVEQVSHVSDVQPQAQTNIMAGDAVEQDASAQAGPVDAVETVAATPAVPESSPTAATPAPQPEDILYLEPSIHKVEKGESLWKLADEVFGDPYLWPYIYRANKDRLPDPDKLTIGMSLVIPGLQREPENLTENDSEHVAEGYYHLYRHYKSAQRKDAYFYLVGARRFNNNVLQSHQAEIDPADWDWATSVRIKAIRDRRGVTDLAGN